jgi:hypothetical protein
LGEPNVIGNSPYDFFFRHDLCLLTEEAIFHESNLQVTHPLHAPSVDATRLNVKCIRRNPILIWPYFHLQINGFTERVGFRSFSVNAYCQRT